MKKIMILTLALCGLVLTSCNSRREKDAAAARDDAMAMQIDSLRAALNQAESESDDLMGTVNDIQEGFKAINEAEGIITNETTGGEGGNRQTILENMTLIQNKLQLNRELIEQLQEQLRQTGSGNAKLKATLEQTVKNFQAQLEEKTKQVAELRAELEKKNIRIAEQDEQISSLNENVKSLDESNKQKDKAITEKDQTITQKSKALAEQDRELHTAYYVFGTKKELKEQKIIDDGHVLKSGNYNKDYFTRIDYRVKKSIPLYSKSAKIMTTHPAGSYTLDKDAKGQYTLRITNADRFWSTSKYLVIVVK